MNKLALVSSVILASLNGVASHSWLECTDYRMPNLEAEMNFDQSNCFGHRRYGAKQMELGFGKEAPNQGQRGIYYSYNRPTEGRVCKYDKESYELYPEGTHKAIYQPGQQVCLAYPSKNHYQDSCSLGEQPDYGVTIRRAAKGVDPKTQSDLIKTYTHTNGEHENGKSDNKGFQNCPSLKNICNDTSGDRSEKFGFALCTMCFQLEDDLAPGDYTFHWYWVRDAKDPNKPDEYQDCWDATVVPLDD